MAAARSPSVLLGPLQALVGGAGAGLLAVDGRVRQPGVGAPRPRGFVEGTAIPDAARVGAPGLPAALAALLASLGASSLLRVAGPAVEAARAASAERARVLQLFARRGVPALSGGDVADEIAAAAGRPAQGLLTREDLAAMLPELVRRDGASLPGGLLTAPWRSGDRVSGAHCHVVAAIDGKGLAAVACYEAPTEGSACRRSASLCLSPRSRCGAGTRGSSPADCVRRHRRSPCGSPRASWTCASAWGRPPRPRRRSTRLLAGGGARRGDRGGGPRAAASSRCREWATASASSP